MSRRFEYSNAPYPQMPQTRWCVRMRDRSLSMTVRLPVSSSIWQQMWTLRTSFLLVYCIFWSQDKNNPYTVRLARYVTQKTLCKTPSPNAHSFQHGFNFCIYFNRSTTYSTRRPSLYEWLRISIFFIDARLLLLLYLDICCNIEEED